MGGSQLDPEESREKKELKNWSNLACYPQTTHQQLIYGDRRNRLKCKVKFRMDEEEQKKPSEAKMRKAEKGGDDVRTVKSRKTRTEGRPRTKISSINSSAKTPCGGSQKARRIDQLTFVK